jgi:cytochrome c-type biogenesis protein CcmH/NrfG
MIVLLLAVAVGLVGLVGALGPFAAGRVAPFEQAADPLGDERRSLLRALRDLDDDRSRGAVSENDYGAMRAELEARLAHAAVAMKVGTRPRLVGRGHTEIGQPAGHGRGTAVALLAVALALSTVPLLASPEEKSDPSAEPLEREQQTDPIASLERRIRATPDDVRARLDLAGAYLALGDVRAATVAYLDVLKLDRRNTVAHTRLALLLFRAGLKRQALASVNRALALRHGDPEALYVKGLILFMGFKKPARAASMFETYLKEAPFGSYRPAVERLLDITRQGSKR